MIASAWVAVMGIRWRSRRITSAGVRPLRFSQVRFAKPRLLDLAKPRSQFRGGLGLRGRPAGALDDALPATPNQVPHQLVVQDVLWVPNPPRRNAADVSLRAGGQALVNDHCTPRFWRSQLTLTALFHQHVARCPAVQIVARRH